MTNKSPVIFYYWNDLNEQSDKTDFSFFLNLRLKNK